MTTTTRTCTFFSYFILCSCEVHCNALFFFLTVLTGNHLLVLAFQLWYWIRLFGIWEALRERPGFAVVGARGSRWIETWPKLFFLSHKSFIYIWVKAHQRQVGSLWNVFSRCCEEAGAVLNDEVKRNTSERKALWCRSAVPRCAPLHKPFASLSLFW